MSIERATHLGIDESWCGRAEELTPGRAVVTWRAPAAAAVDEEGLVHGGFTFGVADHAAMLAVNDPAVVLIGSQVRFVAPVAVGDLVVAEARVLGEEGRRRRVHCVASVGGEPVLDGEFECVLAKEHPLSRRNGARS